MLTKARLKDDVVPAELDYITALRAPEIKALVEGGTIQLSLFDEADLFEACPPRLPGRAPRRLQEPVPGCRGKGRKARVAARFDRGRTGCHQPLPSGAPRRPLRGKDAIALQGRQGYQPLQDGQALQPRDRRWLVLVFPEGRPDRRRGGPGRDLRAAHEPGRRGPGEPRGGVVLQGPGQRRAGLPGLQHRPGHPSYPPPHRRPRAHPRVPAHAVVLRQVPHGTPARPGAVPRRRQGVGPRPRARAPSAPPSARRAGAQKDLHQAQRRPASRSTASRACWPTWRPSPPTASSPTPTFPRSRWSRHRPHFSAGPSSCSVSRTASATCSQYPRGNLPRTSWQQWLSHEMSG
jgi:hypothetical protein